MLDFNEFFNELENGDIEGAWNRISGYQEIPQLDDFDDFDDLLISLRQLCILASIHAQHETFPFKDEISFSCSEPFDLFEFRGFMNRRGLQQIIEHSFFYKLKSDYPEGESFTFLQYAVVKNNIPFCKDLLDDGVDINQSVDSTFVDGFRTVSVNSLGFAIKFQSKELVKELLSRGVLLESYHYELATNLKQYDTLSLLFSNKLPKPYEVFYIIKKAVQDVDVKLLQVVLEKCGLKFDQTSLNNLDLLLHHQSLRDLFHNQLPYKSSIIAVFQYEYLSILNSIVNVLISAFVMIYYSLTKGHQNISAKDLRFFAFGEKQQMEEIIDEIEAQNSPILNA